MMFSIVREVGPAKLLTASGLKILSVNLNSNIENIRQLNQLQCNPIVSRYHTKNEFFSRFNENRILDPMRRVNIGLNQFRRYAMKQELREYGILWKRPEFVPCWHPSKSGDLIPFEEVDLTKSVTSLLCIEEEILSAEPRVQDLLSIAFAPEIEIRKKATYFMIRKIQRHAYDFKSPEVRVAIMTVKIRSLQKKLFVDKRRLRRRERVELKETIDRRGKTLRRMQRNDFKCFEWLIEELDILLKPVVKIPGGVTRKGSLITLVDMHCDKIVAAKLNAYRRELNERKESFREEKVETLKWIAATEKKLGVPITVDVPFDEEFIDLPTLDILSKVVDNTENI